MARRQILDGHKVFMCLTYSKQQCCNWRYALLCIEWSCANLLCIIISKQYVRLCLYVTSDNIGIILLLNYYLKLSWQGIVICFECNMRVEIKRSNSMCLEFPWTLMVWLQILDILPGNTSNVRYLKNSGKSYF